ncbi:MAG TPA: hypothetical protein VGJ37_03410 [Pyrinomonadaceae bacterium]|jgi:hypothetical protein
MTKKNITDLLFVAESGEQGQNYVSSLARLSPSLQSETFYETKLPALGLTKIL